MPCFLLLARCCVNVAMQRYAYHGNHFSIFLDPLDFFHFWDPMCAHDAVILHHSTHVQVNPKPIPFSKRGGEFYIILIPQRVFPIQGIVFASHAHLYIWLLLA